MVVANVDRLRELLARLEEHLQRQQAPIVDAWRPGLAVEQARARAQAELQLRLPVEAEVWFSWHNGVTPVDPAFVGFEFWLTGNTFQLLSLDECIAEHRSLRDMAERLEREDGVFTADERWPTAWLPLLRTGSGDVVFINCDVEVGDAALVHTYVSHDLPKYSHEPRAPSLTDAVSLWVEAFDRGLWSFDVDQKRWQRHRDLTDERLRLSGLV